MKNVALALLSTAPVVVSAQDCISLKDSKACPAFESASISTNATLIEYL